jgi:signal transduction histidine kinase
MTALLKLRMSTFALAIVLMALLVGWSAQTAWRQFEQLGDRLTGVQIVSFQTADQFRANLQALDSMLLRYEVYHDKADRDRFFEEWQKLNEWIDTQRPNLRTDREKLILDQINAAYDDYLTAATNLLAQAGARPASTKLTLAGFDLVERESKRLLGLGLNLVDAHRDSMTQFLAESRRSLVFFRVLIFSSLFVLLVLGAWLAVIVYREMITPLKMKLVESRAIIERQEKLASLGMLAAGVAHEIRNPLTAIKARLFTQGKLLQRGSAEHDDAQVIGQEINRLERIVKDFLLFARPSEPDWKELPVQQPLREVKALLAPQLEKSGIHLKVADGPDATIKVDPQQIKQVLINLVQNAADAIGQNGSVTLRARLDHIPFNTRPADVAILEVIDTGRGIPPEVEKRLFDPFFSTKDGGTGLGLSIAARIVEKNGGALQYRTQVNHGTTFGIILPRAESNERNRSNSAH